MVGKLNEKRHYGVCDMTN